MKVLIDKLTAWLIVILITLYLTGCVKPVVTVSYPPIYLERSDIGCLADTTKRQILSHNCKVDFNKKYCTSKRK
jgi:hypothetical protein